MENEEGEEVGAAVGAPGASGGVAGVGAGAVGVGGVGLLVGQGMHMDDDHDEHHGLDEASLKEHEEVTKVKVRILVGDETKEWDGRHVTTC